MLLATAFVHPADAEEPLEHRLAFERWNTSLIDITIHPKNLHGEEAAFAIPYWAPDVYIAEEFATYVQGFQAEDAKGHPLHSKKTDGQTWAVALDGNNEAVIHYQISAMIVAEALQGWDRGSQIILRTRITPTTTAARFWDCSSISRFVTLRTTPNLWMTG